MANQHSVTKRKTTPNVRAPKRSYSRHDGKAEAA